MRLNCFYCYTIACMIWLGLHAGGLRAQNTAPSSTPESWDFQYDLFQLLLERQGLAPLTRIEQAFDQPQDSVIVLAGVPGRLPGGSWQRLAQFVRQGGTLMVANDSPASVPLIARFRGAVTAGDPENRYEGFADCVKVTDIAADPRLAGVSMIVTNRSSWLEPDLQGPFAWDVVARFPENTSPRSSSGGALLAIGQAADGSGGTIVISADASVFTNGMLWHGDNAILAIRISTLLAGSGRTRLAFWADGQVLTSSRNRIDAPPSAELPSVRVPQTLPEPEMSKVLKLANAVATEVARSNVLNDTLKQRPRNLHPRRYFRVLLVIATVAMLIGAVWILATSGALRPFLAASRGRTKSSAPGRRRAAGQDLTDYRTPAGYLAREFCWELTGSRQSTDWQKYLARQTLAESGLSPSDHHDLARMIDIASRGCRERITRGDFEQLGKTIAALRGRCVRATDPQPMLAEPAGSGP